MRTPKAFSILAVALFCTLFWSWTAEAAEPANAKQKVVTDNRGKTVQVLDEKGRMVSSVRENEYGYPKKIETTYEYGSGGQLAKALSKDADGTTVEEYGKGGRLVQKTRKSLSGPELGRETKTVYTYSKEGKLVAREITNGLMTRKETCDAKGRVTGAVQDDKFGVEWGRHKETGDYRYDEQGFLVSNVEKSQLQTVTRVFDKHELATECRYERNFGLGAMRKSVETTTYDPETGKPAGRVETSDYGRVETVRFDPEVLMPARQLAKYNFGLGSTRETEIQYTWDKQTGLPATRVDINKYGTVQTFYDTTEKGEYGVAVGSQAKYNFGLGSTRETKTVIQSDKRNGLTRATKSTNAYETRWTVYDAYHDGLFGVAEKVRVERSFGLGGTRKRMIQMEVNTWNGLNIHSKEY